MKKIFTLLLIVCSLSSFAQSTLRCYRDADLDGYGDPNNSTPSIPNQGCPFGYVQDNTDCDDNNSVVHQIMRWYKDSDRDGYGDGTYVESCVQPFGYVGQLFFAAIDCDDSDPRIKPFLWYLDHDHDGYAAGPSYFIESCSQPDADHSLPDYQLKVWDECSDNDANLYPRVYYTDADGDGYRSPAAPINVCVELDESKLYLASEFNTLDIDCDDENGLIGPGPEWYKDQDNDGYTDGTILRACVQPAGYISSPVANPSSPGSFSIDCNDSDPLEHPDQGWFLDNDGDHHGQGLGGEIKSACTRPAGNWFAASELISTNDCDDGNATITNTAIWCLDADKDGYYTGDPVTQCASPGPGYVIKIAQKPGDCNDNDETINPETIWYIDKDNDGYHNGSVAYAPSCTQPGPSFNTRSTKGPDCNDNDPAINPETIWYVDIDNDGYYRSMPYAPSCTPPGPSFTLLNPKGPDCNDDDPTINPETVWYLDADGDGYHDPLYLASISCTSPGPNFKNSTKGVDCNDANKLHNPETIWILDKDGDGFYTNEQQSCFIVPGYQIKSDQQQGDCNDDDPGVHTSIQYYVDGDKDGYGSATTAMLCSSVAPVGYSTNNTDCNDGDPAVHPSIQYYVDGDKDGYGSATTAMLCSSVAPVGYSTNNTDCNDGDPGVHTSIQYYVDGDKDGYGSATTAMLCSSVAPVGYSTNKLDCNDNDQTINPASPEVCGNNKDDNCNNVQNETNCYPCGNATNFSTTNITSNSATLNWVSIPNPNLWQIQYKSTKPGTKWIDVKPDITGDKRSVQITGLSAKVKYQWHIKARCGNSWTAYSVSLQFTTLASGITQKRSAETPESTVVSATEAFDIQASPNPSQQSFRIVIGTSNLKEPVKLIVTDILGRVVETRTTYTGQVITIGENYRRGFYLIQAILGKEQKQLKLIKL